MGRLLLALGCSPPATCLRQMALCFFLPAADRPLLHKVIVLHGRSRPPPCCMVTIFCGHPRGWSPFWIIIIMIIANTLANLFDNFWPPRPAYHKGNLVLANTPEALPYN